jgi:hypothetical protein
MVKNERDKTELGMSAKDRAYKRVRQCAGVYVETRTEQLGAQRRGAEAHEQAQVDSLVVLSQVELEEAVRAHAAVAWRG